jgi:predicted AlkP superfamily phosphohydrolase/phosphomutase
MVGRGTSLARVLAARALLILAALLSTACGAPEAPRAEQRYDSLDAFVRSQAGAADAPRQRVVMIGIDGASWDYIRPHMQAGELPALARLVEGGTSARLRSIECHFTPPAWTSMLTGQLPSRTGIYSFGSWDEAKQDFTKVSSNEVQVPAVWDVASALGRKVEVIGVPTTYPPHRVNGVLVSGLMTPKTRLAPLPLSVAPERRRPPDASLESFSPVLTGALEDERNVLLPTFLDDADDGVVGYDQVDLRVLRKGLGPVGRRELGEYRFPVGEFSPWVRVRLDAGPGPRDGFLKLRFDPPTARGLTYLLTPTFLPAQHPFTYPASLGEELYQRFGFYLPHEFLSIEVVPSMAREAAKHARYFFQQPDWDLYLFVFGESDNAHHLIGFGEEALPVYQTIDAFVGEVMDGLGPDTTLVVTSDHGFGAYDHSVDLNQFLAERGLLRWKTRGVIDHARTLVFHNMWHLYFNRKLLSPETLRAYGIEIREGQDAAEALKDHLIRIALEITDADGRAFPVRLARLPADAVGNAPDLAVLANSDFWVDFWNVASPTTQVVRELHGDERWRHAHDGILALYGAGVPAGRDLGVVPIQDVAPTMLDLMGLPVADDLDGEPVPGVLTPERARAQPLRRVASFAEIRREAIDEPEDPRSFEDTLRALGYVRD